MPSKYGFGNTRKKSPAYKKSSGFKMKGSPFLKDVKLYEGSGNQVSVDDANLSDVYKDDDENEVRDYTYTTEDGEEGIDILYLNKPENLPYDPKGSEGLVRPDKSMIERTMNKQRGNA